VIEIAERPSYPMIYINQVELTSTVVDYQAAQDRFVPRVVGFQTRVTFTSTNNKVRLSHRLRRHYLYSPEPRLLLQNAKHAT
jgi:hypothetical protein